MPRQQDVKDVYDVVERKYKEIEEQQGIHHDDVVMAPRVGRSRSSSTYTSQDCLHDGGSGGMSYAYSAHTLSVKDTYTSPTMSPKDVGSPR